MLEDITSRKAETYLSPLATEATRCHSEYDLTAARQPVSESRCSVSSCVKINNSAAAQHTQRTTNELLSSLNGCVMQQDYRHVSAEMKHKARDRVYWSSDVSATSVAEDETHTDRWTAAEADWNLPITSHADAAAKKQTVSSYLHLASDTFQNVVPNANVVESPYNTYHPPALDMMMQTGTANSYSGQGSASINWQSVSDSSESCVMDSEMGRDGVTRLAASNVPQHIDSEMGRDGVTRLAASNVPQDDNTVTSSSRGRGRGLMNLRQLQAAKVSSVSAPGKDNARTQTSSGSADVSDSAVSAADLNDVGGSVRPCSDSECHRTQLRGVDQPSSVHGDSMSSSRSRLTAPPGMTQPPLPAGCTVPPTSYPTHIMPYSWLPARPMCGVLPPGFASPAMPVVGQTLPMPYSSLPVYPMYGYPVMPGSWPVFPPSFGTSAAHEVDENKDSVDKVD